MKEKATRKKTLLAASVAGILAVAGSITAPQAAFAEDVACWGINKCKGTGDCGGKGHSCHGQNTCKGQGWVGVKDEATCLKIEGGSLQPQE